MKERKRPELIKGSRLERIILGSGRPKREVHSLLKQFDQMQKMVKKMAAKGGMKQMMRSLPRKPGGFLAGR